MKKTFSVVIFITVLSLVTGCSTYKPLLTSAELERANLSSLGSYAAQLEANGYIKEALIAYSSVYTSLLQLGESAQAEAIAGRLYNLSVSIADTATAEIWKNRISKKSLVPVTALRALSATGKDSEVITAAEQFLQSEKNSVQAVEVISLRIISLLRINKLIGEDVSLLSNSLNNLRTLTANDSLTLSLARHTLALAFYYRGEIEKALNNITKATQADKSLNNVYGLAEDYLLHSRILLKAVTPDLQAALITAENAYALFEKLDNDEGKENAYGVILLIKNAQKDHLSVHLLTQLKKYYKFSSTKKIIELSEKP